jgi:hypothetical protein
LQLQLAALSGASSRANASAQLHDLRNVLHRHTSQGLLQRKLTLIAR